MGLREALFKEAHDGQGHLGVQKTYPKLQNKFWWPYMNRDLVQYIASCVPCSLNKHSTTAPAGLLHPLPPPKERWTYLTTDLISGFPTVNGKDSIAKYIFCKGM